MKRYLYLPIIHIVLVCALLFVILSSGISAQSDDTLLDEVAELDLKITKTEILSEISSSNALNTTTLSAKEGFNLYAVTLEGVSPCTCLLVVRTDEFSAIWKTDSGYSIDFSDALTNSMGWNVPSENSVVTLYLYLTENETVEFQVAFVLPDSVEKFHVRFPGVVAGEAALE